MIDNVNVQEFYKNSQPSRLNEQVNFL